MSRDPRGSTTARGYGTHHQRLRARWAPKVAAGLVNCARCGEQIQPGQPWHLDHTDDRRGYYGPSHAACNIGAARRRAVEHITPAIDPEPRPTSSW